MTEASLREGCRDHWPESQTLDFKQELPTLDVRGRNEFLKDVYALANADGRDLWYTGSQWRATIRTAGRWIEPAVP